MKPISSNEATSPTFKLEKKVEGKDKNLQQIDKQANKNNKFCLYNGNNSTVFRKVLLSRGNWEEMKESQPEEKSVFLNANFIWQSYNFSVRVVNHFENNRGMCTKTGLIRSLRSYYRHLDTAAKYSVFDTCATSFILTAGINDVEFTSFISRFNEIQKGTFTKEKVPKKHCQENIWLLKPADANQGRGIEILKTQKDIISSLVSKSSNSYWVIQKYIEKPLLYFGRKFDIRIWVLVTKSSEVFIYKTGYIRTCCDEYNMQDIDPNLHLTNNFVQKHHQNYGQHEPGNTLPLDCLFDYIEEKFAKDNTNNVNLREKITQRMKDLIIDTILSVKKSMVTQKRYNNFELFGYDFLIDEDLRTWLIEANTNPYIGVPNDFIKELVPKMANDLVKIVVDPIFPPQNPPEKQENEFELIYCEHGSTFNNGYSKNVRQPFTVSPYPLQKFAQKPNRLLRQTQYENSNNIVKSLPLINSQVYASEEKLNEEDLQNSQSKKTIEANISSIKTQNISNKDTSLPMIQQVEVEEIIDNHNLNTSQEKGSSVINLQPQIQNQQEKDYRLQDENEYRETTKKQKTVQDVSELDENINENINLQQNKENTSMPVVYDPDQMFQNLKKLLSTYIYADFKPFYQHINDILSKMMNWELMSEQELKVVVKTLRYILDSRISNILVDQKYIDKLMSIIDSQNHPVEIQEVSLQALCTITKTLSNKVRIISKDIISLLIKISLSSCDEKEMEKYDRNIRILATNCLVHLGGIYDRKVYIPGETRCNDKIRKTLIENGGLISLLLIRKKVTDEEIKKIAQNFIDNLELSDFEMQYNIIQKWRKRINKNNKSKINQNENIQDSQLFNQNNENQDIKNSKENIHETNDNCYYSPQTNTRDSQIIKRNLYVFTSLNQNIKSNSNDIQIEYPAFLFDIHYFDFEESMNIAENIFLNLKESILKKEKEDKIRRDIELQKIQQLEDERKIQMLERKAKLEEFQKKKEEEKIKKKLEEKKRMEKQKEFYIIEEKKRLLKFEELLKRREELRKLQRKEEEKRKVFEDGQSKYLDVAQYKKQLLGDVVSTNDGFQKKNILDKIPSKQNLEMTENKCFISIQKDTDSSFTNLNLSKTLSNSVTNINLQNINPPQINGSNSYKLIPLNNSNSLLSPNVRLSNEKNKLFSESVQLFRPSIKNQFSKEDNILQQQNKVSIKNQILTKSSILIKPNLKQRNQRQLSPIKILENNLNKQQNNINIEPIQECIAENQVNNSQNQLLLNNIIQIQQENILIAK